MMRAPDYPIGLSDDDFRKRLVSLEEDDWVSAVTKEWLERVGSPILHDPQPCVGTRHTYSGAQAPGPTRRFG